MAVAMSVSFNCERKRLRGRILVRQIGLPLLHALEQCAVLAAQRGHAVVVGLDALRGGGDAGLVVALQGIASFPRLANTPAGFTALASLPVRVAPLAALVSPKSFAASELFKAVTDSVPPAPVESVSTMPLPVGAKLAPTPRRRPRR